CGHAAYRVDPPHAPPRRTEETSMSEATPRERLMTGRSWEESCDAIKAAGRTILAEGQPDSPPERAEGLRYPTRPTRRALEAFIEHADPRAPVLTRPVHETAKIGADNPDNYYQHANISGAFEYRIRGERNTIHYLDFGTQSPGVASTGKSTQA